MNDASLTFRDLTLGYNSHPAVHHLNGRVEDRIADGDCRRQRLGQVDADEGHRRRTEADGRRKPEDAQRENRLFAAAIGARPQLSGAGGRPRLDGPVAEARTARPLHGGGQDVGDACTDGGRPGGVRGTPDRYAVGRPVAACAVCARAGAGRRDHPARRAVQRDRCKDGHRPRGADQALARRETDGDGGRARPRPRAPAFSRNAAAGASSGRLGADFRGAEA